MSSVRKIAQRLARKILRGIITIAYDDAGIQRLQIKTLSGDVHEVPRIQEYGFTSVPHNDAEAMLVMVNDSDGFVFAVDDRRYRLKGLEQGEVALYDDEGTKFHVKRGGIIHCSAATKIDFETPDAFFSGNIHADGDIKDRAQSDGYTMQAMRDKHDVHNHPDADGTTQSPNQKFNGGQE